MTMPRLRFKAEDGSTFTVWDNKVLSEVASMHARIGWQNLRTDEFLDSGDYLLITGTDFQNGIVNYTPCHYVDQWRYDQDLKIQVRNGTVLVTKDGTLGKVAIVKDLPKPATLNAGVFAINPLQGSKLLQEYLYYWLSAPMLMHYARAMSSGGTIKHLNQSILVNFPIKVPCIEEQRKIADLLLAVDEVIAKQQAEVTAWKLRKKGVAQRLFSQEVRFKADDGSDFPEWSLIHLAEIGRLQSGYTFSPKYQGHHDKPIDVYKVADMNLAKNSKEMMLANNTIDTAIASLMSARPITEPSIIFAKVGEAIRSERRRIARKPFITDNNMMAFIPSPNYHFGFCYWLLQSIPFAPHAQSGSPPSLTATIINDLTAEIPSSIEEQRKIADCLDAFDDVIAKAKTELELWRELKRGLLQQLFV